MRRVVVLGFLLMIPALLMTSTIINSWAPYYAGFPMLGLSILGALALERLPQGRRAAILGVYLALGIWARGSAIDSLHIAERALRPSSDAFKKIEAGFLAAAPDLPRHLDLLLLVQVHGIPRVYAQMYVFQPLRLWYRDLSIQTFKPTHVIVRDRPSALAVITSDLDVAFINPITLETRTASGKPPEYVPCEGALRGLAVGLGAAGFADRGTNLLLRIPNPNSGYRSAHLRLAAMLQYGAGHEKRADSLVAAAPQLPRAIALNQLHVILAEQPPHTVYDDFALRAYRIRPDDTDALRDLAGWLARFGYPEPTQRLASRLLSLLPNDPVGLRAIGVADSIFVERKKWPEELL